RAAAGAGHGCAQGGGAGGAPRGRAPLSSPSDGGPGSLRTRRPPPGTLPIGADRRTSRRVHPPRHRADEERHAGQRRGAHGARSLDPGRVRRPLVALTLKSASHRWDPARLDAPDRRFTLLPLEQQRRVEPSKTGATMSTMQRWNPARDFARLQDEVNRLFDGSLGLTRNTESYGWTPAVDVFEDVEGVTFKFDLPEVEAKDVDVRLEDGTLTVRGERKLERAANR